MARLFLNSINLNRNELQLARIQNLATPPSSPVLGLIYYDTDTNSIWLYTGAWTEMATGAASSYYQTVKDNGTIRTQRAALNFLNTTGIVLAAADDAGGGETEISATAQFAAVTASTSFGQASNNGAAGTLARSDHVHGTPTHDGAAHSAISISSLSQPTGAVGWNSQKITGLADGTAPGDATTLSQVQGLIATGTNKTAVRVATTVNSTLASTFENSDVVDGVTLATGDRILIKNQTTGSENGIYTVNASGAPTRATDADLSAEVKAGLSVWVNEGTTQADTRWVLTTNDPITLGSTALVFTQDFAATATTAGAGLTATGNVLAVGAGTGITVAADSVAVDQAVVMTRHAVSVGDGAATSITVTHNKNTKDVIVSVYDNTTPFAQVECDVEMATVNTITLKFATAPTSNQYRCVVIG